MDPTLDPNAPVRAETGRDEISSRQPATVYDQTPCGTRRDRLARTGENFETAPFDRSGISACCAPRLTRRLAELAAIPAGEPEIFTPNLANAAAVEAVPSLINRSAYPRRSAVRDHDLPEMPAVLEMLVGRLGLGEWECPIDHGAQAMQFDRPVHRLKIGAAADADRPDRSAAAG